MTGIREEISGIKKDVTGIREDISGIKKDVTGNREDMNGLVESINKRIDNLKENTYSNIKVLRDELRANTKIFNENFSQLFKFCNELKTFINNNPFIFHQKQGDYEKLLNENQEHKRILDNNTNQIILLEGKVEKIFQERKEIREASNESKINYPLQKEVLPSNSEATLVDKKVYNANVPIALELNKKQVNSDNSNLLEVFKTEDKNSPINYMVTPNELNEKK